MYFKKLELYGFKSFVDKTSLLFEPGVTAIVGPNGTGKSNISDAIKWVLGEQSAKSMRGAKMEDVIFNGTETRPAVNMAEVSLTLSNKHRSLPIDYDEVTVTRRIYRSGESEYLLNKTLVRLKDINELLMGTGIGTESYSLLEQGRIDAILSSKPEDRRVVFEEASGITRYKKKKNEALRKLDQTEDNLLRVNDIITEVNRQLNSIQRQVGKARRYQEHFERLKSIDIEYIYREYKTLYEQRQSIEQEETVCRSQQAEIEIELNRLAEVFTGLKESLSGVEVEYGRLSNTVVGVRTQLEKDAHSISLNKERIEEFSHLAENVLREIKTADRRMEDFRANLEELERRVASFDSEKAEKEQSLGRGQEQLNRLENEIREAKEAGERGKSLAVEYLAEQAQLRNELAKLSVNIHNASARLARLRQEKDKTGSELEKIGIVFQEKCAEVERLRVSVEGQQVRREELKILHQSLVQEIEKSTARIQERRQFLVGCRSQLEVLEELDRNYEGFSGAVRALMAKRDEHPERFGEIYDVLVNLIDVKPGYEVCAESVLGDYLQAIVVKDRPAMLELKEFIDSQGIGRVRLISLDQIPEAGAKEKIPGVVPVSEVITCQNGINSLLQFLMKDIYLHEDLALVPARFTYNMPASGPVYVSGDFTDWQLDEGFRMEQREDGSYCLDRMLPAGTYNYKFVVNGNWINDPEAHAESDGAGNFNSVLRLNGIPPADSTIPICLNGERLVTRWGDMFSATEVVSRPASERGAGLVSRKAQIKQLNQECVLTERDIEQLCRDEQERRREMEEADRELNVLTDRLHQEKIALANRDSEKANVEKTKKSLDDELAVILVEIDETELDERDLRDRETGSRKRLDELEELSRQNEEKMTAGQQLLKDKSVEREDLLMVITELKTEVSLLREKEASLNSNLSMVRNGLDEQQRMKAEFETQKEDAGRKIEELTRRIGELEENRERLEAERLSGEAELERTGTQRNSLLSEFEAAQTRMREKEKVLNQSRNRTRDLEVKRIELNYRIDSLVNSARQSYKTELAEVQVQLPGDVNWEERKREIEELKGKIDRIGSVNLAAVEEEEELRQRADFLNSQRDDLLKAKGSLMQAIQKINRTTRALFLETFEKSKVAFREYFKLLFGGGDAHLELTEEKDVLESGIEIAVRPPGKKLQSITLLSGGEKTLTAIALLFGIFKIKPTPFCVLDEMDAPLDESNIDRFNRVLQEFIKTSQFIIITHNKKTIGMADVMYGVTMQQPGVSRLVSVKFSEYKENEETVSSEV